MLLVQERISRRKTLGIAIAVALIEAFFYDKRWSVTKQVGSLDVQEAYTRLRSVEMPKKNGSSKRELIDTGTDKRHVRRDDKGQFKESDDQGRSLAQDIKREAKTQAREGQARSG